MDYVKIKGYYFGSTHIQGIVEFLKSLEQSKNYQVYLDDVERTKQLLNEYYHIITGLPNGFVVTYIEEGKLQCFSNDESKEIIDVLQREIANKQAYLYTTLKNAT